MARARINIGDLAAMGYLTGSGGGRGSARSRRARYEAEYDDDNVLPF